MRVIPVANLRNIQNTPFRPWQCCISYDTIRYIVLRLSCQIHWGGRWGGGLLLLGGEGLLLLLGGGGGGGGGGVLDYKS